MPHADLQSVLILQTHGAKRWRVWSPLPAASHMQNPLQRGKAESLTVLELGEPLVDVVLQPGAVLHVPAGFPHATSTPAGSATARSIALTVGLETHSGYQAWHFSTACMLTRASRRGSVASGMGEQLAVLDWSKVSNGWSEPLLPIFKRKYMSMREQLLKSLPVGFVDDEANYVARIATGMLKASQGLGIEEDEYIREEADQTARFFVKLQNAAVQASILSHQLAAEQIAQVDTDLQELHSRRTKTSQARMVKFCQPRISDDL